MTDDAIIYTYTDEAPALATASLLPIVQAYAGKAGVEIETRDISLGGRILAAFPQRLSADQEVSDALAELGGLATLPEANIIKLPNISASIPQLKAAIAELRAQGYDIPSFPDEPSSLEEKDIRARYDRIKGSAVNPVLREGNSDRRAPLAVKNYAKKHPHTNKPFAEGSKTRVATMTAADFKHNEKSWVAAHDDVLTIRHTAEDGTVTVLKDNLKVLPREIIDATFMSASALDAFLAETFDAAKADDVLYSVHLKATMMKVSDPIIFGHVVKTFFADVFARFGDKLAEAGLSANDGLGSILSGLAGIDGGQDVADEFARALESGPRLSYVNSDKGITNLHVPSDVIVDASMPALVRNGGKLWGVDGGEDNTLAVIPDSSYASVYQAVIDDVIANGPLNPATIGTVPNVGLMAQAAEEYGSHDKTFEIASAGRVEVVDGEGTVVIEHQVEAGDIWRATQTKHIPVMDWVKLAVTRAQASGSPAVFWLDLNRAHDAQLIAKVHQALATLDTTGAQISILAPEEATRYTLARMRHGLDTISVTGNVLRDYLTDLFPILEVGTSAKMLSIVPLLAGGGLFETGAGGSAPKHVQQLVEENYLRWDSLGEFFALAASLEHFADRNSNEKARVLAETLDAATGTFLEEDRSPGRKLGTIDNRGSHFYLGLYWAQELVAQTKDAELAAAFAPIAADLAAKEQEIVSELNGAQGAAVDIGGYYRPDVDKVAKVMRPSATLNEIIDAI
ncbi:NADP-dependent isocitrate dehydrogenase [Microbacterium sp. AK031]|uniref:NADP-dependent isocitrate dehydrogenase n=1 Tax=Microbacterium sp. AK031 TaxID=2723076 RepID=UPI00216A4683|nr:NADP-dependent isocitrate dehydrogenase [Microbacterium sp. AK031]MCS3841861.1 isocitrate dehydrogenase [Microbacterium sp. AK031]